MNFLAGQLLIYTGETYESIYKHLNDVYSIKYQDLFVLAAQLGFKNDRKKTREGKGREFRSNYLSLQQKGVLYALILNEPSFNKDLDTLNDKDFQSECKNILEEYAIGGLEYLCESLFGFKWNGIKLDEIYDEYDLDLMSFIKNQIDDIPF